MMQAMIKDHLNFAKDKEVLKLFGIDGTFARTSS